MARYGPDTGPRRPGRTLIVCETRPANEGMENEAEWPRGVARVEPPWLMRGDAFIVLTASSTELNLADASIPSALRGVYHNLFNVMVLADYRESPVGPFKELLYIPGRFRFGDDDERM